jgi:hypothetical protein
VAIAKGEDATGLAPVTGSGEASGGGAAVGDAHAFVIGTGISYSPSSAAAVTPLGIYPGVSSGGGQAVAAVFQATTGTGIAMGRSWSNSVAMATGAGLSDDRRYYVVAEVRVYYIT